MNEDTSRLDREGDIAADYLEELLDIADLDGDIEIGVEADRASVAIINDGVADRRLKRLIGRKGEALSSLQELTRLAVQQETGERSVSCSASSVTARIIANISPRLHVRLWRVWKRRASPM